MSAAASELAASVTVKGHCFPEAIAQIHSVDAKSKSRSKSVLTACGRGGGGGGVCASFVCLRAVLNEKLDLKSPKKERKKE